MMKHDAAIGHIVLHIGIQARQMIRELPKGVQSTAWKVLYEALLKEMAKQSEEEK